MRHDDDPPIESERPSRLRRWRQAIRETSTDEWLKYGIVGLIAERLGLFDVPHMVVTRVCAALMRAIGL